MMNSKKLFRASHDEPVGKIKLGHSPQPPNTADCQDQIWTKKDKKRQKLTSLKRPRTIVVGEFLVGECFHASL
jgi:hypothetical protein